MHLKVADVARLFGVSVQAVHLWLKSGRIRSFDRTSPRGSFRIPRREIVRLLAAAGCEVPGLWEKPRIKVLLIDDDSGIRGMALAAAKSPVLPMNLKVASTVEDGILLAAQFGPEVILLDAAFPKDLIQGDLGLAFIRHAKLTRDVRVVAMVESRRQAPRMTKAGADMLLVKPFDLTEFRSAIYTQWKSRSAAGKEEVLS